MERIRFIDYDGKEILLIDLSGCQPNQVAELADQVPGFVTPKPPRSVLLLADFSDAKLTKEAVERIKIAAVINREHLRRSAWVFNGNIPKTLHDAVKSFSNREIPKFETREEAMKFLVHGL
jgi:hypothetical protein